MLIDDDDEGGGGVACFLDDDCYIGTAVGSAASSFVVAELPPRAAEDYLCAAAVRELAALMHEPPLGGMWERLPNALTLESAALAVVAADCEQLSLLFAQHWARIVPRPRHLIDAVQCAVRGNMPHWLAALLPRTPAGWHAKLALLCARVDALDCLRALCVYRGTAPGDALGAALLHEAAAAGHARLVLLLCPLTTRMPPLRSLVMAGRHEALHAVLLRHADLAGGAAAPPTSSSPPPPIDEPDADDGTRALHVAAMFNQTQCAALLVRYAGTADGVWHRDAFNRTPADLAPPELARLLRAAAAGRRVHVAQSFTAVCDAAAAAAAIAPLAYIDCHTAASVG